MAMEYGNDEVGRVLHQHVDIDRLCQGSIVRRNLLTVPGYAPFCGNMQGSCNRMERTKWDVNRQQFVCRCGWISNYPADFVQAYVTYRINSQVCAKCGVTCGQNKSKYCGDGGDKDNSHRWVPAGYKSQPVARDRCPRCDSPAPGMHPAMQFEGEVQLCEHPWHQGAAAGPQIEKASVSGSAERPSGAEEPSVEIAVARKLVSDALPTVGVGGVRLIGQMLATCCVGCDIRNECDYAFDLYNIDCEPKIDCLASK